MILVTGSEGGLGKRVVHLLHQRYGPDYIVRVSRQAGLKNVLHGNLDNRKFVDEIFNKYHIEYIVHCAAMWNGFNMDYSILENNTEITMNIFKFITPSVKTIVYLSSSGVYDSTECFRTDKLYPSSAYGISKLFSENLIKSYCDENEILYTILRPFHIVSPDEKYAPPSSHVMTDMFYRIIKNSEQIEVDSLDDAKFVNFTWADDVAEMIVHLLDNSANETFNIGSPEWGTVKAMVVELMSQLGICEGSACNIVYDNKPFQKLTSKGNWHPCGFTACVKNFVDQKLKNGEKYEDYIRRS